MNSQKLQAWISSLRLRTLPLSCCVIMTGTALVVAARHTVDLPIFIFSLLTALLLQVVSNLANDYGDMKKGTDTVYRLGPKRGMQNGLIDFKQMQRAILLVGLLSILSGLILIILACRSYADMIAFIVLGLISLIAAITYTMGKHAYGYYGLGDLSVLIFFGYVGVMGSFYLQTHQLGLYSFFPATACGFLGVLVLNINNMRDIEEDTLNGKLTLAVKLGYKKARYYHLALLAGSLCCLSFFALFYTRGNFLNWLFLLALPLFYLNGHAVYSYKDPVQLQKQLGTTVKMNVFTLTLFAIGLCLG